MLTVLAEIYPMGFVHGKAHLVDKCRELMGFVHGKAKMVDKKLVFLKFSVLLLIIELFWFAIHDQMALIINHLDHGKKSYLSQCHDCSGI